MSRLWKAERGLRAVFKVLEFITSIYFIYAIYHIGPHWIMLIAALAVPVYGLYLVLARSVDPNTNQGLHSIPYLRYKTLVKAKVWQRADIAISVSMSIVFCGFSAILFFGYFKIRSATTYFLHSAISALLLAFLYTFDALVTVCQLKSGSVAFVKTDKFTRSFPNDSKHVVQADFTRSFTTCNEFNKTPSISAIQNQPIQLPNSSSANVPTILDRLRLEIENEHKYSTVTYPQQSNQQQRSWFDEERNDELTSSTSLSNTSAQQQIDRQQYWEENRQINDLIVAPTKKNSKTTYSRFQQIDEPMELQPNLNLSNSSSKTQITNKRLDMNSKMSSLEEELPAPPNSVQHVHRSVQPRPIAMPVNQYKISSYPYSRKAIYPANDHQKQQIYTQIPQNRPSSNRNSETTDTSAEDLHMKSRLNASTSQHNPTILNYPLDLNVHTEQPRPAPLIYYKQSHAHVHPPVKARMVVIEDDPELLNRQQRVDEASRGSSKSSATARIDEFEHSSQSSTRPSISSNLVHMNASH